MPETLDPVTRHHIDQAANRLAEEFAGIFSQETIARYMAESTDLLGEAKVNVFVPVLAERFARERLETLRQGRGFHHFQASTSPRCSSSASTTPVAARWPPGPHEAHRPGDRIVVASAGPSAEPGEDINPPAVRESLRRARHRHLRGVSEPLDRRLRARRGRRDHHGLRRRLPHLSRQAATRTGKLGRPHRQGRRRPCAPIREDIDVPRPAAPRARAVLPESDHPRPSVSSSPSRRHLRAGLRRLRRDHGRREDPALGHVGIAITFGLVIVVDDRRPRPRVGSPFQPCRHGSPSPSPRHFPFPGAVLYLAAQLLGAIVAAAACSRAVTRRHRATSVRPCRPDRQRGRSSGSSCSRRS